MAFVMDFGTGFEMGFKPTRAGVMETTGLTVQTDDKHTGSYSLGSIYNNQRFWAPLATDRSDVYASVWIKPNAADIPKIYFFYDLTVTPVYLQYNGTYWDAYVKAVKVAEGTVATTHSAWQHVQVHVVIDDSVGVIETVVDGVPDISYAGDTQPGAEETIAYVVVHQYSKTRSDDIAVGYGGWPGDIRFDAVLLDGDDTVAWTPSTGTDNYALLDEVPPSSTDYVSTTADASDLYTLAAWDDTDGSGNVVKDPIAVTLWVDARKEDGNYNDLLRLNMQDGVNTVTGDYETLLTSYEHRWLLRMAAPDGGEWTKAKIDALLVGIDADME